MDNQNENFIYHLPASSGSPLPQGSGTSITRTTPGSPQFTGLTEDRVKQLIGAALRTITDRVVLASGVIQSQNYVAASAGWNIDNQGNAEFNNGTFRGVLTASSINIPDTTTANSFHVDSSGNAWWGATTLAGSVAKVLNTGAATFTSGAIGGFTIGATTLTSTNLIIDSANKIITLGTGTGKLTLDGTAGTIASNNGAWSFNGNGTFTLVIADVQIFTANGTWTKPNNVRMVKIVCIGAGGGGGAGVAVDNTAGAGGGAGGAVNIVTLRAADVGATETITVGSGGTGGTTSGSNGGNGGLSSFGSWVQAGGGGGGLGNPTGGGGGGALTSGSGATQGIPGVTTDGIGGQGVSAAKNSEFGGAGGAGGSTQTGGSGGSSIYAGPGGGGGGGRDEVFHFEGPGGPGGTCQKYTAGGGGAGGATHGGAGTNGSDNSVTKKGYCGDGGGGGGGPGQSSSVAGNGGNGGIPGAGGGGGGSSFPGQVFGTGGNGGRGEVRVYSW